MKTLLVLALINIFLSSSITYHTPVLKSKENYVAHNQHFDSINASKKDGFSISFITKNIIEDEETLLMGKNFKIRANRFDLLNDNKLVAYWENKNGIINKKLFPHGLLSSGNYEQLITFSFNYDSSISTYINGDLYLYFPSFVRPSYTNNDALLFDNFFDKVFESITSYGFNVGVSDNLAICHYTMKDLVIFNHYIDEDMAKDYFSSFITTKIKYIDEYNRSIYQDSCLINKSEYDYSFISPTIEFYHTDDLVVRGHAYESKSVYVKYRFNGQERITSDMINSHKNILDRRGFTGWDNDSYWLKYGNNFSGDFNCRVEINNQGITQKNSTNSVFDYCWRTALPIVYNPTNKDRWVCRFDSYGWLDDINKDNVHLGSNANYNNGKHYVNNFGRDLYYVLSNCDISIIYTRINNTLKMNCKIYPNVFPYETLCYNYFCSLDNINTKTLSLAFSCEDSMVTIKSVIY